MHNNICCYRMFCTYTHKIIAFRPNNNTNSYLRVQLLCYIDNIISNKNTKVSCIMTIRSVVQTLDTDDNVISYIELYDKNNYYTVIEHTCSEKYRTDINIIRVLIACSYIQTITIKIYNNIYKLYEQFDSDIH